MNNKFKEEAVFIPGPRGRLEAEICNAGAGLSAGRVGVICHPHPLYQGTMANKVVTTIARAWQELDIATIRFNFRGVGKSEGEYGQGVGEQEDLSAVLEWAKTWVQPSAIKPEIKSEIQPAIKLYLAGFSFGSYVSAAVAAANRDPVEFLLSVAPPVQHFGFPLRTLPTCPWLVIQGDQDEIVAAELVKNWVKGLSAEKSDINLKMIVGASHFFHGKLLELKAIIQEEMAILGLPGSPH